MCLGSERIVPVNSEQDTHTAQEKRRVADLTRQTDRALKVCACLRRPARDSQRPAASRQAKGLIFDPTPQSALLDRPGCPIERSVPVAAPEGELCPRLGQA